MLEQEIKLSYPDADAARQSITSAGGRLVVSRRLLDDRLFDTADRHLKRSGLALRVRRDGDLVRLAFKGPVQQTHVKTREELETTVGDATIIDALLRGLGYRPVFRSQKFREDYEFDDAYVVLDDTPMGVFVEIEGSEPAIHRAAERLGRSRREYRLESYGALWRQLCDRRGWPADRDMLFDPPMP